MLYDSQFSVTFLYLCQVIVHVIYSAKSTLISGNPAVINEQHYGSQPPIPVAVNPIFTPQPLIMAAAAAGMNNQHAIRNSLMTPRPRGAAGIRGLGKILQYALDLRKILGVAKKFLKSGSFFFQTQQNP